MYINKHNKFFFALIFSFFTGLIFFYSSKLKFFLLHILSKQSSCHISSAVDKTIKKAKLFYKKNDKWDIKTINVLCANKVDVDLKSIIGKWLLNAYEDKALESKVFIESVTFDEALQSLFISFNKNPLILEYSIYKKFLICESICRTIRENSNVSFVQFLVCGEIINDDHLDLSIPWPTCGFT